VSGADGRVRRTRLVEEFAGIYRLDTLSELPPGPDVYPPYPSVTTFVFIDFGVGSAFKLATGDGHIVVESPTNAAGPLGVLQLGEFGPTGSLGRNSRMPSTQERSEGEHPVSGRFVGRGRLPDSTAIQPGQGRFGFGIRRRDSLSNSPSAIFILFFVLIRYISHQLKEYAIVNLKCRQLDYPPSEYGGTAADEEY